VFGLRQPLNIGRFTSAIRLRSMMARWRIGSAWRMKNEKGGGDNRRPEDTSNRKKLQRRRAGTARTDHA